jgi:hypothetical protein
MMNQRNVLEVVALVAKTKSVCQFLLCVFVYDTVMDWFKTWNHLGGSSIWVM